MIVALNKNEASCRHTSIETRGLPWEPRVCYLVRLSQANLKLTARLIPRHREAAGCLWRSLNPGRQSLLALACLRKHETLSLLAW